MHNPQGFKLLTDEAYINELLEAFKTDKDVNNKNLQKYFSNRITRGEDGFSIKSIERPLYYTTDEFILKKGTLPNVKEDTQTNIGFYIFNLYVIASVFGDLIPYYCPKEALISDNVDGLQQKIIDLLLAHKATGEQFSEFQTRFSKIGFKGTLWTPGQSYNFIKVNPEVAKAKPVLLKKWREAVAAGEDPVSTYVTMVEKPLLNIAKENLKNDPSWPLYARGGKPKFGNMYKNCTVSMGPVYDPVNGTYKIAENSYMEGVDNNMVSTFANIQVDAAYNRAVGTQIGGADTKLVFAAMQTVKLNPKKGSDCGSTKYREFILTKKNLKNVLLRYIVDDSTGKLVMLTNENASKYVGKKIKMRSAIFCKDEAFCNICAGDYFYELGVENIGNTIVRMTSKILNLYLKSMHDISVDATEIEPWKYIKSV